ncbi:unnamed protein product [Zymoseptoria tritici ST99CH_1A5]|uniref:Uncharacterized protein n=1 Tax=Zymoseptoria tritici ST99CH_1A5 TaxID=1276529 RepID=A0A1Y6M1H8_ZYMTR|nr:unnamed protein product [Zymoseptoria tritici ST99CH_1A5]
MSSNSPNSPPIQYYSSVFVCIYEPCGTYQAKPLGTFPLVNGFYQVPAPPVSNTPYMAGLMPIAPYAAFAPYPQPGIVHPGAVPYPNLAPQSVPPSSSTSRQTPASTEQQQGGGMMRPPPIPSPHRSDSNASRLESVPNSTATSAGTRNTQPTRTSSLPPPAGPSPSTPTRPSSGQSTQTSTAASTVPQDESSSNTQALAATQPNAQTQQTSATPISRTTRAAAAARTNQNTASSSHVAGPSFASNAPPAPRGQPSRDGLVGVAALLHKASGAKPMAVTRQQKNGLTAQLVNLVRLLERDFKQFELSFVGRAVVGLGREGGDTDETKSKFDEQSEDARVWPHFKLAPTKDQAEFVRWAVGHWLKASGIYNTTFLTFMSDCFEQYESLKYEMEDENDSAKAGRLPAKQ